MGTVRATRDSDPVALDRVGRLEAFYRTEYAGTVRLAVTLVGDTAESEEFVQDSLLEVFRRWHAPSTKHSWPLAERRDDGFRR